MCIPPESEPIYPVYDWLSVTPLNQEPATTYELHAEFICRAIDLMEMNNISDPRELVEFPSIPGLTASEERDLRECFIVEYVASSSRDRDMDDFIRNARFVVYQ
jgi:hypothetical protein